MSFNKKTILILTVFSISFALNLMFAYAADTSTAEQDVGNSIFEIYDIIRAITVPLAVVGITGFGIQLITNQTPEGISSAKRGIIIVLIAVAAIMLLPVILSSGADIVGTGWDPNIPG